jgi:predicted O-methyltransferase YrrM
MFPATAEEFRNKFQTNLENCLWEPHPSYSVFTQYDGEWYLDRKEAFIEKYRNFFALAQTILPDRMIELGVCAGSSADAYLSGSPRSHYTGIDTFGEPFSPNDDSPWKTLRRDENSIWKPRDIAQRLLTERGFKNFELITANLRHLSTLPHQADLVIVDAAHDFENQYADLKLALTAQPVFIFVDDADDEAEVKPAIAKFQSEDVANNVDYTVKLDYTGGGLIIRLRNQSAKRRSTN